MTYGIVAIVKDEVDNLPNFQRWLDIVPPERWTICDTGSSDGTGTLLEGWGVKVWRDEWVNFGHNRSLALARARGTAEWLLALDADMTVDMEDHVDLDPDVDAYMIDFGWDGFRNRLPLLLRGDLPWESRGAVHEYTTLPDRSYSSAPTDQVRIRSNNSHPGSRERSLWHAEMLEAEVARSDDPRAVFYLARTYDDLHDARAIPLYERRIRMGGWEQEVFYSKFRRAMMLPSWPAQLTALLEAWEYRPGRLEAPYEAARGLNYRGQHRAAYRLASTPLDPSDDILFVHTSVWDWGMKFERSIAAWWLGLRDEFAALSRELLDLNLPANIRSAVERNLAL